MQSKRRVRAASLALSAAVFLGIMAPGLATDAPAEPSPEPIHVHQYVEDPAQSIPASCTGDGLSVLICPECGDVQSVVIPPAGHSYLETERVEPAEEQAGYIVYVCEVCGDAVRQSWPEEEPQDPENPEDPEEPADPEEPEPMEETDLPSLSIYIDESFLLDGLLGGTMLAPRDASYSASQYFFEYLDREDIKNYGLMDPQYTGSAITNLTPKEKQSLTNAILGFGGENPTACVLAAQLLHDQYLYLGASDSRYRTVYNLLSASGQWDRACWSRELYNPDGLDAATAEAAFRYVFEEGNAFFPHVLLSLDFPEEPETPEERAGSGPLHLADIRWRENDGREVLWVSLLSHSDYDLTLTEPEAGAVILPACNSRAKILLRERPEELDRDALLEEMCLALYQDAGGQVSCKFDGYTELPGHHEGIDFVKEAGCPVYSLVTGQLVRVSVLGDELSTLAIYDLENDVTVFYLHLDIDPELKVGDMVHKGARLGTEGAHGASGAHTHLEVVPGTAYYAMRSDDEELDNPEPYAYWDQILRGGNKPTEITLSQDREAARAWILSKQAGMTSPFFFDDSILLVPADPDYHGHSVTGLTGQEKNAIILTIYHEMGADLGGSILVAQELRDMYDYYDYLNFGHAGWDQVTWERIICTSYSSSYWEEAGWRTDCADLGYAYLAYQYVFEQGGSAVAHRLLAHASDYIQFDEGAPWWHKTVYYVPIVGDLTYFWYTDLFGDYVNGFRTE